MMSETEMPGELYDERELDELRRVADEMADDLAAMASEEYDAWVRAMEEISAMCDAERKAA